MLIKRSFDDIPGGPIPPARNTPSSFRRHVSTEKKRELAGSRLLGNQISIRPFDVIFGSTRRLLSAIRILDTIA
jgi:hypothetical protein